MYSHKEYFSTNNLGNFHDLMLVFRKRNDDGNISLQLQPIVEQTCMVMLNAQNDMQSSRKSEMFQLLLRSHLETVFPIFLLHLCGNRCRKPRNHYKTRKFNLKFDCNNFFDIISSKKYTNLMKKNVSTLNAPFEIVWNQNSFSTTFRSSMLSAYLNTMIHV